MLRNFRSLLITAGFTAVSGIWLKTYLAEEVRKPKWEYSNLSNEFTEILTNIARNLEISVEEKPTQSQTPSVRVLNALAESKSVDFLDYSVFSTIVRFSNPPNMISAEDLSTLAEKIPDNERLFLGFFEKMNRNQEDVNPEFNELKYLNPDANSHYYFIEESVSKELGLNKGEAAVLRPLKSWNNPSSLEIIDFFGKKFIIERLSQGQKSFTEDPVGVVTTDNEMINFLRNCNMRKKRKFLIYHPIEKSDPFLENRILRKLADLAAKDPEISIIYTKNESILPNFFRIIPEKFIDTVRVLDFGTEVKCPTTDGIEICSEGKEKNRKLNTKNYHRILLPQEYNIEKFGVHRVARFKYQGKITRKRLDSFLSQVALTQALQWKVKKKGKRFKSEVLDSRQDWLVFFFKADCSSCKALKPGFEKFASIVQAIPNDASLITSHKILNPEKFKNLKVARYNIFNECAEFANPSNTPLLLFFKGNKNKNPKVIDLLKERVNIASADTVVDTLIRMVDNRL